MTLPLNCRCWPCLLLVNMRLSPAIMSIAVTTASPAFDYRSDKLRQASTGYKIQESNTYVKKPTCVNIDVRDATRHQPHLRFFIENYVLGISGQDVTSKVPMFRVVKVVGPTRWCVSEKPMILSPKPIYRGRIYPILWMYVNLPIQAVRLTIY